MDASFGAVRMSIDARIGRKDLEKISESSRGNGPWSKAFFARLPRLASK